MGTIANAASGLISTLSTVSSVVNTLSRTYDAVNRVSGNEYRQLQEQQQQALRQTQEKQRLAQTAAQSDAQFQVEQQRLAARQAEETRQRSLRSAVARRRAEFGASGVESTGGSGEAVLLGMFEDTDVDRRQRSETDALKERAIGQSLQNAQQRNLLELTQQADRQKLERELYRF